MKKEKAGGEGEREKLDIHALLKRYEKEGGKAKESECMCPQASLRDRVGEEEHFAE